MGRGDGEQIEYGVDSRTFAELTANAVDVLPQGMLTKQLASGKKLRIKLGVDPTAPDIHLGHVVVLNRLRDFQRHGHQAVLIIGDFTSQVGDPTGKNTTRPVLTPQQVAENARTYTEQAFKILDPDLTEVRFNSEWLKMDTQQLLPLLQQVTVSQLLTRDDFKKRLDAGEGISALEMLYPLFQGYDSEAVDADVELGGTDQKFNLLFARNFAEQSVLTLPLLVGTDGSDKMSKSKGNYIGVDEPPQQMFGKAMSIPDQAMGDYYTLLLNEQLNTEEHPNKAKRHLARKLVERFHSAEAALEAEQQFDQMFVKHQAPDQMPKVKAERNESGLVYLPALLSDNLPISKTQARRLIDDGAVKIDGQKADGYNVALQPGQVLQSGKRNFLQVSE